VDGIEGGNKTLLQREGVGLNECVGIVRLMLNINPDNLESGTAIPYASTPGATEKIKKSELTSGSHRLYGAFLLPRLGLRNGALVPCASAVFPTK
jgi:hypothetical protein